MGKRREPRVQLDVPVKVCGMDTLGHPFVQTAYAVSISRTGVRLTGVGPLVRLGEVVVVIYKQRKARFRVVWIGEVGQPEAGQAGLEATEPNALIWDFALPHPGTDGYVPPDQTRGNGFNMPAATTPAATNAAPAPVSAPLGETQPHTPGVERRNAPRFKCRGSANIFVPDVSFPTRGQIDDISLSGVYIQTTAPLLAGSAVNLHLAIQGFTFKCDAEVRTSHPGVGMGLMFTGMDTENRMTLGAIISRLSGVPATAKAAATPVGTVPQSAPPATTAPAARIAPRWDALGREISEWFRSHETLSREDFFNLIRRQ
jgi:hypothetical protein